MGLMPSYFTTTRTSRKSRRKVKTKSLLQAEKQHQEWRVRMGLVHRKTCIKPSHRGSGERSDKNVPSYQHSVQNEAKGSTPFTSTKISYHSSMAKKADKVYTGTEIIGIATMHKSNAIPVRSKKSAEEVARMRRG